MIIRFMEMKNNHMIVNIVSVRMERCWEEGRCVFFLKKTFFFGILGSVGAKNKAKCHQGAIVNSDCSIFFNLASKSEGHRGIVV